TVPSCISEPLLTLRILIQMSLERVQARLEKFKVARARKLVHSDCLAQLSYCAENFDRIPQEIEPLTPIYAFFNFSETFYASTLLHSNETVAIFAQDVKRRQSPVVDYCFALKINKILIDSVIRTYSRATFQPEKFSGVAPQFYAFRGRSDQCVVSLR